MTAKIYTLSCPNSGEVKYVGRTIHSLSKRLNEHYKMNYSNAKMKEWILSLKSKNEYPIIEIIDLAPIQIMDELEQYWIGQMKAWGFNILNRHNTWKIRDSKKSIPCINVRTSLSEKSYAILEKRANEETRSVSNLIRIAIEKYLMIKN